VTTVAPTSSKIELPLRQATPLAEKIVATLSPQCEQIAIAGSIRRNKPIVGDIEIVCIPDCVENLIGERGDSLLDPFLDELIVAGRLTPGRCRGDRYAQFGIPAMEGLKLDLFMTTAESWGVIMAIRTGPAAYSKWLVTRAQHGGALPNDARIDDGRLFRGCSWQRATKFDPQLGEYEVDDLVDPGQPIDTPTEELFFDAIDQPWIHPANRSAE
jgi:DNA polymerase/3'-5' exonuclease PolX